MTKMHQKKTNLLLNFQMQKKCFFDAKKTSKTTSLLIFVAKYTNLLKKGCEPKTLVGSKIINIQSIIFLYCF